MTADFDPGKLREALAEACREVDGPMIEALGRDLLVIRQRYRARLAEKEQVPDLAEISKSLAVIRDAASKIIGELDEDVRTGTCSLEVTMAALAASSARRKRERHSNRRAK
jgi:hypothetical protein